jgi:hypothetical protein
MPDWLLTTTIGRRNQNRANGKIPGTNSDSSKDGTAIHLNQTVATQKSALLRIRPSLRRGGCRGRSGAAKIAALERVSILAWFCR